MRAGKVKMSKDEIVFNVIGYIVILFFVVMSILPIWLIVAGSFSSNTAILTSGYSIGIKEFTLDAYKIVFKVPAEILSAYKVSIIVTACGAFSVLFICSSAGYVLSCRSFKYRKAMSFYYFFTTIFSAGLAPWYVFCVQTLKFKDHPYFAMVFCGAFSYFYVIIFRSFMSEIPASLRESAQIDGANDIIIFVRIILPLSKPVLATVGLFAALAHWGDWYYAMLFCSKSKDYPLQYYLYTILNKAQALSNLDGAVLTNMPSLPTETYKLAITVVTTGPIILLYPFVQKYFVKGMTVGAVKG